MQQAAGAPALSEGEKSRRRFERRLVSSLAQNPVLALSHADALAQTQWHDGLSRQLAESMLTTLENDPAATPATIVSDASKVAPRAAGILTAGMTQDPSTLEDTVAFLVEEIEIGDMESTLASMNAQLRSDSGLPDDERELIFAAAVDLQKTIAAKRAAHKPRVF